MISFCCPPYEGITQRSPGAGSIGDDLVQPIFRDAILILYLCRLDQHQSAILAILRYL